MKKEALNFSIEGVKATFKVEHNLDKFHLSIESALINWLARTNKIDIHLFCEYVKSKDVNIKCNPLL